MTKEDRYLNDEAETVQRSFPLPWFALLLKKFVSAEKVNQKTRVMSYLVFEKI